MQLETPWPFCPATVKPLSQLYTTCIWVPFTLRGTLNVCKKKKKPCDMKSCTVQKHPKVGSRKMVQEPLYRFLKIRGAHSSTWCCAKMQKIRSAHTHITASQWNSAKLNPLCLCLFQIRYKHCGLMIFYGVRLRHILFSQLMLYLCTFRHGSVHSLSRKMPSYVETIKVY